MLKKTIESKLVCPYDHKKVNLIKKSPKNMYYQCKSCSRKYPIVNDIPNFLPDSLRDWTTKQILGKKKSKTAAAGNWKPGFRGWSPDFLIKLLSFGIGEGRVGIVEKGSILDVGCGDVAKGDVNTDVYIPTPLPKNFLLSTAELLPFKNSTFDIVRSAYVIEHNLYPVEMMKEHLRVCRKKIKIYTDNSDWIGVYAYRLLKIGSIFHDEHYYKWSKEYFTNILNRLGWQGKVSVFNTSPSFLVKGMSLLGKLPRIGIIFYRDLYAEIYKR